MGEELSKNSAGRGFPILPFSGVGAGVARLQSPGVNHHCWTERGHMRKTIEAGLFGLVVALGAVAGPLPSAAAGEPDWKVGLAHVKITPEQPVLLAGYGGRTRPFEKVTTDSVREGAGTGRPRGPRGRARHHRPDRLSGRDRRADLRADGRPALKRERDSAQLVPHPYRPGAQPDSATKTRAGHRATSSGPSPTPAQCKTGSSRWSRAAAQADRRGSPGGPVWRNS